MVSAATVAGTKRKYSHDAAARCAERAAAHPPGTAGRLRRSNTKTSERLKIWCCCQPADDDAGADLQCRKASGGREGWAAFTQSS